MRRESLFFDIKDNIRWFLQRGRINCVVNKQDFPL